jgi:hypothetical protein
MTICQEEGVFDKDMDKSDPSVQSLSRSSATDEIRCLYYDVFVSHARLDESHELVGALKQCGLHVWYDEDRSMDDAQWSYHINGGLRNSRSVICFVGSRSLEEHTWVQLEIRAAAAAAEKANCSRVFVVVAGGQKALPHWLNQYPVRLQYETGDLNIKDAELLAKRLRELNRVDIQVVEPPVSELFSRVHEVHSSIERLDRDWQKTLELHRPPGQNPSWEEWAAILSSRLDPLETLRHDVDRLLSKLHNLPDKGENFVYNQELEEAFRDVYVSSHGLEGFPSEPALERRWITRTSPIAGSGSAEAGHLARDVALLTAITDNYITDLTSDCKISHLVLERLAASGVETAYDLLSWCLRWVQDSSVVGTVSDYLHRNWRGFGRDEVVLKILKSDHDCEAQQLALLRPGDEAVLLRYYARRMTASVIGMLDSLKRAEELKEQLKRIITGEFVDMSFLEVALRDAISNDFASSTSSAFTIKDIASPKEAQITPTIVLHSCHLWPRAHLKHAWKLDFVTFVITPLAVLNQVYGRQCGAYDAASEFIALLETPVSQCRADVIRLIRSKRREPQVFFAIYEILYRRRTIRWLRGVQNGLGVNLKNGGYWQVENLPSFIFQLREFSDEKERFSSSRQGVEIENDTDGIIDCARRVLDFWSGLPLF